MIKFTTELTVKKVETKTIKKRDGGDFTFTEATLEQGGKKPVTILARVSDELVPELQTGKKQSMDIGITSFTTSDGRVFNNFLVTFVDAPKEEPAVKRSSEPQASDVDELPF